MAQQFDASVPSPARIWNYWVGGKDNLEADRAAAEAIREVVPYVGVVARLTRQFLIRAVTMLASDFGIRQFIDIGSGLPTVGNTHEVVQRVIPGARVVYVDNDRWWPSRAAGCSRETGRPGSSVPTCVNPRRY